MSSNRIPIHIDSGLVAQVQVSTANTNRDGSGTIGTLLTASGNGYLVTRIDAVATVTTSAGLVTVFLHDGSNYRLFTELTISAVTPSATLAAATAYWTASGSGLYLPSGWSIRVATTIAQTINVFAHYGTY